MLITIILVHLLFTFLAYMFIKYHLIENRIKPDFNTILMTIMPIANIIVVISFFYNFKGNDVYSKFFNIPVQKIDLFKLLNENNVVDERIVIKEKKTRVSRKSKENMING